MIRWTVVLGFLISDEGEVTWGGFEHLTGKRINWNKRIDKDIITFKDRGHVRIYDCKFIKGEVYKHRSGKYDCAYVNDKGEALLNKHGSNMVMKTATIPFEDAWEVV